MKTIFLISGAIAVLFFVVMGSAYGLTKLADKYHYDYEWYMIPFSVCAMLTIIFMIASMGFPK